MADRSVSETARRKRAALEQGYPLQKPRQMWDAPGADNPSTEVRPDMPRMSFNPIHGFGESINAYVTALAENIAFEGRK